MKIGVNTIIGDKSADIAVVAQKLEELGFESLWLPDHPAMPVNSAEPYPDAMAHMADPLIGLARASAATQRLKLGTGICLVPMRNPLNLAKEVSTLDLVSGGRFLFGIGAGRIREEMELFSGDFDHRWTQVRESVLAMKMLWTKDEAEYHGNYVNFPPTRSFPKPVQKPHPPVILGSYAKNVFRRVVSWGDGWMPSGAIGITPEQVTAGRRELERLAAEVGRDPGSIEISIFAQPSDADLIKRFEDAGADRFIITALITGDDPIGRLEKIADQVLR